MNKRSTSSFRVVNARRSSSALSRQAPAMSRAISYALFVEGPVNATGNERATFVALWTEYLTSINSTLPHIIVPIQKTHLVAMDPNSPTMSGASEALDHLIARIIKEHQINAIAIAWDLTPPWDPDAEEAKYCRWNETKKLYELLAQSTVLPNEWKDSCEARSVELGERAQPGDRAGPFTLREYAVVPICMEPEFEGLLVQNEGQIMRAVGLAKIPAQHWPRRWGARPIRPRKLACARNSLAGSTAINHSSACRECADTTYPVICGSTCLIGLIAGMSPQRISAPFPSGFRRSRRFRTAAGSNGSRG